MTETKDPKFTCEVCGREGDYIDFIDLNDNDWNDPFVMFTFCPQCYEVTQRNEILGSIILIISFTAGAFLGFDFKMQILNLLLLYGLNLIRIIHFSFFLFPKIRRDNTLNPKKFLLLKLKDQLIFFLTSPIDVIISPIRFFAYRIG